MSTAVCKWRRLAHRKLAQYIKQKKYFFYKQLSQSLQFFRWKPTDGISCVPVSIESNSGPAEFVRYNRVPV